MIFKLIFEFLKRIIQLAVIVFFGYWLYQKLFVGGLAFGMLTLTIFPFLIVGVLLGLIISLVTALKGSPFKFVKIINIIFLLCYISATVYISILIF